MTTILACKKDKKIVIGADSLIVFGDERRTRADSLFSKLIPYSKGVFGFAGDAVIHNAFTYFLTKTKPKIVGMNSIALFKLFSSFLKFLEDECGYKTDSTDSDFKLTSSFIYADSKNIYHVDRQRFISNVERFFAVGSGREYAMGAAHINFATKSARDVVTLSLEASAYFDVNTAHPFDIIEL